MKPIGFERYSAETAATPPPVETPPNETSQPRDRRVVSEIPLKIKTEIRQEITNKLTALLLEMSVQNEALEYLEHGIQKKGEIPRPRTWQVGVGELAKKFKAPGVAEIVMQKTQREIDDLKALLDNLDGGENYEDIADFLENSETAKEAEINGEIDKLAQIKTDKLALFGPTPGLMKKRIAEQELKRDNETNRRLGWVSQLRSQK
ncbi:MAG: hypothetical protein WCV71_03705 [Patescibacteria group bacterium]